jgi:hypothetical protein
VSTPPVAHEHDPAALRALICDLSRDLVAAVHAARVLPEREAAAVGTLYLWAAREILREVRP